MARTCPSESLTVSTSECAFTAFILADLVWAVPSGIFMTLPTDTHDPVQFDNSYGRLPGRFFARLDPVPVASPRLLVINVGLARQLGLDPNMLASPDGVQILSGNQVAAGSQPIAMAYAGHQFGRFVPQLGDGRAMLLGEVIDSDGARRDIQLKGSGRTPFSRRGDGRAALGPVLREYLISEAFAALGIPTTRSLAAIATGDMILREEGLVPGAVLTRVAASHVRVGTFQYFAGRGDLDGMRTLADYVIARHFPNATKVLNPYQALLEGVIDRQAKLVARWMLVGFIHGVMNTDNMSIAGETLDFGPCAFLDAYDPNKVFSAIDQTGRYAFGNQADIAQWNLARFAETLLPLLSPDIPSALKVAQEAIEGFSANFQAAHNAGLRVKLGLSRDMPGDAALAHDLLDCMTENAADFTLTFRALSHSAAEGCDHVELRGQFAHKPGNFDSWLQRWRARLAEELVSPAERQAAMRQANPAFIPRNHRVEEALQAAGGGDLEPFNTLHRVLANPFLERPDFSHYAEPPAPGQVVHQTFCGT